MKIDKLFTHNFSRDAQSSKHHDVGRGVLNGLMLNTNSLSSTDTITIKVRSNQRTEVLANRLSMGFVSTLSDMKGGIRSRKSSQEANKVIFDYLDTLLATPVSSLDRTDYGNASVRAVFLDLGHITLGEQELEVIIETGDANVATSSYYDCYMVQTKSEPDYFIQYDSTKDYDTTQNNVEKIFLLSDGDQFVDHEGNYKDLQIQVDTDTGTLISDTKGTLSATNIFGNFEFPEIEYLQIFKNTLPIGENLRCKINGSTDGLTLLFVKYIYPKSTSNSTLKNLQKLQERVEKLEAENAEQAKRMRHAGKIQKSEELAEAEKQIKAANDAETEEK